MKFGAVQLYRRNHQAIMDLFNKMFPYFRGQVAPAHVIQLPGPTFVPRSTRFLLQGAFIKKEYIFLQPRGAAARGFLLDFTFRRLYK
jgi:hypothetical protein